MLSENQKEIFDKITRGENVVVMGSGGTGKSYILKEIIKWGKKKKKKKYIGVTAMTGIAAVLIGGSTIHSFCGIGIAEHPVRHYIRKLRKINSTAGERIRICDVLLLDEFSMTSSYFFQFLLEVIMGVRRNKPLQYVFFGDPKQLGPVYGYYENDERKKKHSFENECFLELFRGNIYCLTENFRHKDKVYAEDLEKIGEGILTEDARKRLENRIAKKDMSKDIIHLYATNDSADEHNDYKMEQIMEEEKYYPFKDSFEPDIDLEYICPERTAELMNRLKRFARFQDPTVVKKYEFVMCKTNVDIENGWANGTVGHIVDYINGYPLVCRNKEKKDLYISGEKRDTDDIHFRLFKPSPLDVMEEINFGVAIRKGIPLVPAWGITIHKSQGSEFDSVFISSEEIRGSGQAYVALARVKSIEGLFISGVPFIKSNKIALDFVKKYIT